MEIGSISDWLSSLSTFGTLVIAGMAYRKAPDWFESKRNETSYDHAKKIIDSLEQTQHLFQKEAYIFLQNEHDINEEREKKQEYSKFEILRMIFLVQELIYSCEKYNIKPQIEINDYLLSVLNFVINPHKFPFENNIRYDEFARLASSGKQISNTPINKLFKF
ncbi:hypothetical protein [Serratia marcescens]|uniref:hypothetical protein n=1 Tax=Serratia marcescens TaxID=615 RepID=UPI003F80C356